MKSLILAALAASFSTCVNASSITVNPFTFSVSDGTDNESTSVSATSVAGFCDPLNAGGCDGGVDVNGAEVYIDWVDGDSFDIGIFAGPASDIDITLTGLTFSGGKSITSVDFNLFGSAPENDLNIDDYVNSPANQNGIPAPFIYTSFLNDTSSSLILINIDQLSSFLWGDGITMRFDVGLSGSNTNVVPLPASGWLLVSALLGLFGFRKRLQG